MMYLRTKEGILTAKLSPALMAAVLRNVPGRWEVLNVKGGQKSCFVVKEMMVVGDPCVLQVYMYPGDYIADSL